jgi:hypothetical protein
MAYGSYGSSLRDLPRLRDVRRRRVSSWDRSGGNQDWITIRPGETATLAEIAGAGNINHIWMAGGPDSASDFSDAGDLPGYREQLYLRKLVVRMYWDGEAAPSVLVPLGDFFGAGHARTANFVSLPLQMSPRGGVSFNSFFHMPFAHGARIELLSELDRQDVSLWFYVDYETFDHLEDGLGRFHAQWRRQNPCDGVDPDREPNEEFEFGGTNLSGEGNYVILEAEGRGHYVGCLLNVHNLRQTQQWNWYGEGDDMIFIDGEGWPPSLHGTGTEDYFNTCACPDEAYSAPYHGLIHPGGANWSGYTTLYRFHVEDPVPFERSIRVTIEHGHANKRSDDYSSVAYWYQAEPHRPFGILPVAQRLPRSL